MSNHKVATHQKETEPKSVLSKPRHRGQWTFVGLEPKFGQPRQVCVIKVKEETIATYECPVCALVFNVEQNMEEHRETMHPDLVVEPLEHKPMTEEVNNDNIKVYVEDTDAEVKTEPDMGQDPLACDEDTKDVMLLGI